MNNGKKEGVLQKKYAFFAKNENQLTVRNSCGEVPMIFLNILLK